LVLINALLAGPACSLIIRCFLKKGKMDNHQKWMAKAIEEAIKSAQN
jgi:hypothetical protein